MKIVSFDPAAKKNLGIAVVKTTKAGKIKTVNAWTRLLPDVEDGKRPWLFYQILDEFLTKEKPDLVVFERTDLFGGSKYIRCLVTKCICMIECICGKNGIPTDELAPASIKKRITGNGRATKKELQQSVREFLLNKGLKTDYDSEHSYDAVAVVMAHLEKSNGPQN